MGVIRAAVFISLFCAALPAMLKVKDKHVTAFFGEDIHIVVSPQNQGEVLFQPRTDPTSEVVLLREGVVLNARGRLNRSGHLILENVQEEDEGTYIIKNLSNRADVSRLILIVRDCALEQVVKYGDNYHIPLNNVQGPITLEFRASPAHSNETQIHSATDAPAVVLYNRTAVSAEEYVGRLSVTEKRVTLRSVRMADEGSFTVLDREDKVRRKNCLNVREHQTFVLIPYSGTLKIDLYLHHSKVNVAYKPSPDGRERIILDQGALVVPMDPVLDGRLTVEDSVLLLKKVHVSDMGTFKVTDLAGFPVANVYLEVEAYRMPPLYVVILPLLGFIAFLLLVCLLSCLLKVHRRKEKNKKLTLIAEQAGKRDGEAFRQVVNEAYTRFTEESQTQSTWENPTESTEVTIKGLEVSKPGRYEALPSYQTFMEMSDSGVEFTSSALPLDSITDIPMTFGSHENPLNLTTPPATTAGAGRFDSWEVTVVVDGDLSTSRTPVSALTTSPASNPPSVNAVTPNGSLPEAASPGTACRGTVGSDLAKMPEGGTDNGCEATAEEEGGVEEQA